ncbi:NAD(P)-binding protein [Blyttiomyces helicus]|uniref:NAD(P)-binding protein n=1 Tax=Blyttiomyces helicus TaxID=388810 RepID=A0A4P9W0Z3_9FUNG|nr:NAD(P)-binding protein [Blyttiomyces helicus]|eukprot:RKO83726.1 NAD(P)-binding protein [Blyttiomyces helicus]
MDLSLQNVHVLITGASGGVGVATAALFLSHGANVTLQYNTALAPLAPLCASHPHHTLALKADVTHEQEVATLVSAATARFGVIGILVVCHGIWPAEDVALKDMSLDRWRGTIAVNLDGTFLFARAFLKQLETRGDARGLKDVAIVLVGSTAGKFGEAFHADYSCTKSAMMYGLTLSLKNEIVKVHPAGRVNCVSPGWIRTPMAERAMKDPALLYQALASTPTLKVSEPSDIANAILFLSSSTLSGNITGISLDVNGGMEGRILNKPEDV